MYVKFIFTRSWQMVFQSNCIHLYSHRCLSDSVDLQSLQHLVFSIFFFFCHLTISLWCWFAFPWLPMKTKVSLCLQWHLNMFSIKCQVPSTAHSPTGCWTFSYWICWSSLYIFILFFFLSGYIHGKYLLPVSSLSSLFLKVTSDDGKFWIVI